jgi:hypothetical protein
MRASVSPRQSPSSRIRWSMSLDAGLPALPWPAGAPATRAGARAAPPGFVLRGEPPVRPAVAFAAAGDLAVPGLALALAVRGAVVADVRGLRVRDVAVAGGVAFAGAFDLAFAGAEDDFMRTAPPRSGS